MAFHKCCMYTASLLRHPNGHQVHRIANHVVWESSTLMKIIIQNELIITKWIQVCMFTSCDGMYGHSVDRYVREFLHAWYLGEQIISMMGHIHNRSYTIVVAIFCVIVVVVVIEAVNVVVRRGSVPVRPTNCVSISMCARLIEWRPCLFVWVWREKNMNSENKQIICYPHSLSFSVIQSCCWCVSGCVNLYHKAEQPCSHCHRLYFSQLFPCLRMPIYEWLFVRLCLCPIQIERLIVNVDTVSFVCASARLCERIIFNFSWIAALLLWMLQICFSLLLLLSE